MYTAKLTTVRRSLLPPSLFSLTGRFMVSRARVPSPPVMGTTDHHILPSPPTRSRGSSHYRLTARVVPCPRVLRPPSDHRLRVVDHLLCRPCNCMSWPFTATAKPSDVIAFPATHCAPPVSSVGIHPSHRAPSPATALSRRTASLRALFSEQGRREGQEGGDQRLTTGLVPPPVSSLACLATAVNRRRRGLRGSPTGLCRGEAVEPISTTSRALPSRRLSLRVEDPPHRVRRLRPRAGG